MYLIFSSPSKISKQEYYTKQNMKNKNQAFSEIVFDNNAQII